MIFDLSLDSFSLESHFSIQIDNLNIEIYDDEDNLINMNNQDWSITLELKTTLQVTYNTQSIDEYLNNNN